MLRSESRMTVNPDTISSFSTDPPHQQIASKHLQIGSSCFTAYPTQITVISHLPVSPAQDLGGSLTGVVQLTHINFCCCGFLLAFLHVLYVSHKLNLLMLSSRHS